MRYDAAILGAGPDGLAAAARLARAGLKTIVLEKSARAGGRCTTTAFHPGFRASPYMDELAPVPAGIFWSLDLARRGAIFFPEPLHAVGGAVTDIGALTKACALVRTRITQELRRADTRAETQLPKPWLPWLREPARMTPPDQWSSSMVDMLADLAPAEAAALMARALAGRVADPTLRGSALHLLAPGLGSSGMVAGGLATLGDALAASAREAGAEIVCGSEATGIRQVKNRIAAITLADGSEIEAAAAISTLDFKRTMLSLFRWSDLPEAAMKRATHYRSAGSTARLLVALEAMPQLPNGDANLARATFHTAASPADFADAYAAWRSGVIPAKPPASIRIVSAGDMRLAPRGQATVTLTLGCIPHRLFEGTWTDAYRDTLRERAMAALETVFPGAKVLGSQLLVPPDFEEALGATDGDLAGGEIAPDQMFANRACPDWPRTAVAGFYLGGPSSPVAPLATGASGWIAAKALIADRDAGRT